MAKLIINYDDESIKEVPLSRGHITIGRKPGNDIKINKKEVSSTHAKLFNYGSYYFIQDLDSLNGTYVNGEKIKKHRLNHGDKIVIGYHTLVFTIDSKDEKVETQVKQLPTGETVLIGKSSTTEDSPPEPHQKEYKTDIRVRLSVVSGSSEREDYFLVDKTTVIGRKSDAQVKLKSLLAPKVAAVIQQKSDGYYISSPKKKLVKINENYLESEEEYKLEDGSIIDTGSLTLKYMTMKQ